MYLSREDFERQWASLGEDTTPVVVDTAWKRYQQVQSQENATKSADERPSTEQFNASWSAFFADPAIAGSIQSASVLTLPANKLPFTPTQINVIAGQQISTFATGRVWRSELLDLYLPPSVALWFKIGNNGRVFNSTGDSNTFEPSQSGPLYVANQFPGQFGEPDGGRPLGPLNIYDKAVGSLEISIIVWKAGVDVQALLKQYVQHNTQGLARELVVAELGRMDQTKERTLSPDWSFLWFLGQSSIYSEMQDAGSACMHCRPYGNVGIIQKNLNPGMPLTKTTMVSWDWLIKSLPSRLREDTTLTHDYLSVAFEFENGRDITYTWSWELPEEYGYWCPLPHWEDREYHVVIQSGTEKLGKWLSEKRNLYTDYVKYIEDGRQPEAASSRVPEQITRVWFIAGNRMQRFDGEMTVKNLVITDGSVQQAIV